MRGTGKQGWSSVLAFDKKPSVDLNKNGELRIFFQKKNYNFIANVDLNKWYNISIEQKPRNKEVWEDMNKSLYTKNFQKKIKLKVSVN